MDYLKFSPDKLSVETITDLVTSEKCGAASVFVGTTRDNFEGKEVIKLEYESYETMGLKAMEKICKEIRTKFTEVENIAIYHRLGVVPVKEASIIIAISSPHRADAIKATEFCIDSVKSSVPIWKKEVYKDNGSDWKENKELNTQKVPIKFKLEIKQEVECNPIPSHLIQIKATTEEIEERIQKFMDRKRDEINMTNIRDFCHRDLTSQKMEDESCARIDSVLIKRKDSKGHLQVNKVYNNFSRDQSKQDYLMQFIPKNGIEERLLSAETQLSMTKPVSNDIYKRIKNVEDRLMYLESISPEYIQFWDKTALSKTSKKKRVFSVNEINNFISDLESRKK